MQVQLYREGGSLKLSIPTAQGEMKAVCDYGQLTESDKGNPVTLSMPDPHPSVSFSRPTGERPLYEQEQLARDHRAASDTQYREENQDQQFLDPPNSGPESKTQQDSIRGPGATAQIGMTDRELRGVEFLEEQAAQEAAVNETAEETSAERPAASLPDSDARAARDAGTNLEPGVRTADRSATQRTAQGATGTGQSPNPALQSGERAQAENTKAQTKASADAERAVQAQADMGKAGSKPSPRYSGKK
jgi:hypothetical protein